MYAIMHRMDAIDTSDSRLCWQIDADSNEQTMFITHRYIYIYIRWNYIQTRVITLEAALNIHLGIE